MKKSSSHLIKLLKNCIKTLLNGDYCKYTFKDDFFVEHNIRRLNTDDFQKSLSKIDEMQDNKEQNGVYYTPCDVTDFIVANLFFKRISRKEKTVFSYSQCFKKILGLNDKSKINRLLFRETVLDPTSGDGEFLVSALKFKISLLEKSNQLNDGNIIKTAKTIFGNDICKESNVITKLRLFFVCYKKIKVPKNLLILASNFNNQFTEIDMIQKPKRARLFDILIGNPPYVESSEVSKYGNIYADVLENAFCFLKENGSIGFILPISYVSTPRMSLFREQVESKFSTQITINFADRPSCLFTRVHQKLSILFAYESKSKHTLLVSNYRYWYRDERKSLFDNISCIEQPKKLNYLNCYCKISKPIEINILNKITNPRNVSLYTLLQNGETDLYLNMREYFWTKAFSFNPGSSEYKMFHSSESQKGFYLCLLNSSLFFYLWVVLSDCWHITRRELSSFTIPKTKINYTKFTKLSKKLENKLEKTKVYIKTKQADYAYKHKLCKDIIDEIDLELAKVFRLTKTETNFIQNYILKYRMGT